MSQHAYCILRAGVRGEGPCEVARCRKPATDRMVFIRPMEGISDGLAILLLCTACAELAERATGDSRKPRKSVSRRRTHEAEIRTQPVCEGSHLGGLEVPAKGLKAEPTQVHGSAPKESRGRERLPPTGAWGCGCPPVGAADAQNTQQAETNTARVSLQPSPPKPEPAKPAVVAGYAGSDFKVSDVW